MTDHARFDPRGYQLGEFHLDLGKRRLIGPDGAAIPLSARAYDVLVHLVTHRDRVVDRSELIQAVWPQSVVEDNNLDQAIAGVRRALHDTRGAPRFVLTVAGRGYRFIADASALSGGAPSVKVVAVLPFRPLLPGSGDAALELGVTELLINRLSRIPGTVVTPLSSVLAYTNQDGDPIGIGQRLGAWGVVEGHLQIHGDRVRLTARLLAVDGGVTLWANSFTDPLGDLLVMQDSLAMQIADALDSTLSREIRARVTAPDTQDAEAWQLYANGRLHIERRYAQSLREAVSLFTAALARDPGFALAAAGLSDAHALTAVFGIEPPVEAWERAKQAALRAVELDASLPAAHVALGHVATQYDVDLRAGYAHYATALERDDGHAQARALMALNRLQAGDLAYAARLIRSAQAREPASFAFISLSAWVRYFERAYDDAARALTRILESVPHASIARQFLARVLLARREGAAVVALLEGHDDPAPGAFSNLARAYIQVGDTAAAAARIAHLQALRTQRFGVDFDLALIHVELGDHAAALDALERGVDSHSSMQGYLNVEPALDPIRSDRRFQAVVARMNLS